jgi:Asp-tRNA(Asn)/Glu-tRNA(Gln) amidotransferase A subunit family amidase
MIGPAMNRRELLAAAMAAGVGNVTFQKALAAKADDDAKAATPKGVSVEMVKDAEWIAGITLSDSERTLVAAALSRSQSALARARSQPLPNHLLCALHFVPDPGAAHVAEPAGEVSLPDVAFIKPGNDEDLAYASISQLAKLLRTKTISSVELTKFFLARLRKSDANLKCVVTFTDELAVKQAKQADEELAAGTIRGPLHGIPWGAKDLISVPGYPTTWGAAHYQSQTINTAATVFEKLSAAGAVLVAKLTLGALAWGDVWFGGQTRNPWNPKQGSSGSSAGSASAVSAGCVPFAIGSETLGSIVSPCTRCGVTGLRPTFGRVSRAGCMAISWSMDKLGPIARSVGDCAQVLGVIHGRDSGDAASRTRRFDWPGHRALKDLRVGIFEKSTKTTVKETLTKLGVTLVPIELPKMTDYRTLGSILTAEAATIFDDLTRAGVTEGIGLWPLSFREGQFITAVEYLRANRLRSRLMEEMAVVMDKIDCYVGGDDLQLTNLTGHPSVVMPNGLVASAAGIEVPTGVTFTGRLFRESELLTVAQAWQEATGHHLKRPPKERFLS